MYQLSPELLKLIRELADRLPPIKIYSHETHMITGAEILSWKTVDKVNGKPINPAEIYKYSYPVVQLANHYRRLKRAYKAKGQPGMEAYFNWVMRQAKARQMNGQMKAVKKIVQIGTGK